MTDKEAMKLALFALDIVKIHYTQSRHINEAITALKERLADSMQEVQRLGQEIEQEPVGMVQDLFTYTAWEKLDVRGSTKVYLDIPPQRTWVGLTEEDRAKILSRKWWDFEDEFDVDGFLRLAEAKLKEKNT
jgi:hypothetical protein